VEDATIRGGRARGDDRHRRSTPAWWLVARRELVELWFGGRILLLLVLYTVLMSVTAILRVIESEVNLIPPVEMVFLTVLSTISFGMFIGLIAGADTISGERERATLEPLLLTPTSRRQIVFGKFIAALSPWPVALLLAVPYAVVLSQGDAALVPSLAWTALLGTLLAVAFTGFGMLVSIWSGSNRTSLFVSLLVYLLFVIPTQFPGQAQKGNLGYLVQQVNPMQASSEFIEKLIVNNRDPLERAGYLVAQPVFALVVLGLLFVYAAPRVRLEGETPRLRRPSRRASRSVGVLGGLLVLGGMAMPLLALAGSSAGSGVPSQAPASSHDVGIEITTDLGYAVVNNGDDIEFSTVIVNTGDSDTPELVVAMNIINLGKGGDPVDPEDWSPERTQEVGTIAPGASAEQAWFVSAILDGNYMIYMTVVATPDGTEATSHPIASPGVHLTVQGFARSNPGGVLPVAIGVPLLLSAGTVLIRRWWNRERVSTREPGTNGDPA